MRRTLLTSLLLLIVVSAGVASGQPVHGWSEVYGGGDIANPGQIAVDDAGNLYLVGGFTHAIDLGGGTLTSAGNNDIFLARFTADGTHVWSLAFGGTDMDLGKAIAVLPGGDIIVGGTHRSTIDLGGGALVPAVDQNAFLARFDASGAHVWSRSWGGAGTIGVTDIAIMPSDDIAIIGTFTSSVDFGYGTETAVGGSDLYVMVNKSSGSIGWVETFGGVDNETAGAIAVDNNGDIFYAGSTLGDIDLGGGVLSNHGGRDIIFGSIDDGMGYRFGYIFGGTEWESNARVAHDGDRVYLSGTFTGNIDIGNGGFTPVGTNDTFLAAYSNAGTHLWSSQFGLGDSHYIKNLDVDATVGILAVGQCWGPVDFGGGAVSAGGGGDVFAARFETDGTHIWSGAWGDANLDDGACGIVDEDGIYLHGEFEGTLDFGGTPLTDTNYYRSIYCARLDDPASVEEISIVDVGNDQGRQVRLTFGRSDQDAPGSALPIVQYDLYRRIDPLPGVKLGDWDFLGTIPARGEDEYSLVLPTLADSTIADGMYWSVFMVRAATADIYTFWDSRPDSGYSLDNLAPGVPTGLMMAGANLSWDEALDADFDYFTVYSSPTSDFATATPLGNTTGTSFDATGTGGLYIAVAAIDFAGNISDLAIAGLSLADVPGSMTARTVLHPNVPNPFNPSTVIRFELREAGHAALTVHDVSGRLVRTLVTAELSAGPHEMTWNGCDGRGREMPSAVYFYRLKSGDRVETRQMTLLK